MTAASRASESSKRNLIEGWLSNEGQEHVGFLEKHAPQLQGLPVEFVPVPMEGRRGYDLVYKDSDLVESSMAC